MRIHSLVIACLLLPLGPSALAQYLSTPIRGDVAVWDTTVARSLLVGTANAALLVADSIPDVGYASLGGGLQFGKLRRPQHAETERAITFEAQRYQHIGAWLFYGRFAYQQQQQQDLRWTGVMDPYRGTPFVLADSTVGDWKKHQFALDAGASIPLNEHLTLGLAVQYLAGSGAKNRDPRPLSNVNDITLRPSATWKLGVRHVIGGHAHYRGFKEDVRVLIRAPFVQGLYRLKGLSFHDQVLPVSASYTREYRGTEWGGGLQHLYRTGHSSQWVTDMAYTRYSEITQDGTMTPQSSGDYRNDRLSASTSWRYGKGRMENTFSLAVHAQRGVGHEYHYVSNALVFDGDMYRQEDVEATMRHEWRKRKDGTAYHWYIAPAMGYRQQVARYPTSPSTSRQQFGQLVASVEGGTWVARQLEVTAAIHYQTALSRSIAYYDNGQAIASSLLFPDYDYQTADYLAGRLGLRYLFSPPRMQAEQRRFFVELSGTLRHRLDPVSYAGYGSNRAYSGLTIGMYY